MTERKTAQFDAFQKNQLETVGGVLPDMERIPTEFLAVVEKLRELTSGWYVVEWFTATPNSIKREKNLSKAALLNGGHHNPSFEYNAVPQHDWQKVRKQLTDLLQEARNVKIDHHDSWLRIIKVALINKIKDDLAATEMAEAMGSGQTGDEKQKTAAEVLNKTAQRTIFAGLDQDLIDLAHQMYAQQCLDGVDVIAEVAGSDSTAIFNKDQVKKLKEIPISSEQVKTAFEWVLAQYGLLVPDNPQGYTVEISEAATSPDVRAKVIPKVIVVPKEFTVPITAKKLIALLYHEIEGHARQEANGADWIIGGGALRVHDETLTEAVAMGIETDQKARYFGEQDATPTPLFAFAVELADSGADFDAVFKDQLNRQLHITLRIPEDDSIDLEATNVKAVLDKAIDKAWKKTYRVFRGHVDTSNAQAFANPKDLGYLRGWKIYRELQESGKLHYLDSMIPATNALPLLGRIKLEPSQIRHPFVDHTKAYVDAFIMPMLDA